MGEIARAQPREEGGLRLWVEAGEIAADACVGDSVAVDGCCLTVVAVDGGALAFDVIPESLERTSMGTKGPGDRVNLERPLRPTDRMGGHFVQGHVDAVAQLVERRVAGDAVVYAFSLPAALRGHIVEKGSVAIDGVSLTVAGVEQDCFTVALIPHTLAVTTLGSLVQGGSVNLEGDILAKYVASLLEAR